MTGQVISCSVSDPACSWGPRKLKNKIKKYYYHIRINIYLFITLLNSKFNQIHICIYFKNASTDREKLLRYKLFNIFLVLWVPYPRMRTDIFGIPDPLTNVCGSETLNSSHIFTVLIYTNLVDILNGISAHSGWYLGIASQPIENSFAASHGIIPP